MEAFSLLKYWRTSGAGAAAAATTAAKSTPKTTVSAAVSPYSSDGEDGPYFDLEFALPDPDSDTAASLENDVKIPQSDDETDTEEEEEEEAELKFSLSSNECTDQNAAASSPSDDLFFKGDMVAIEPSSILLNAAGENPRFPVFLVKSASKFRVLMLKLKKSKSANGDAADDSAAARAKSSGKFFVKLKLEEAPLVNLFTRDGSAKEKPPVHESEANPASDERKLPKEVVAKYLKMVKPFYIRVSKRYVKKLKLPGGAAASPPESNVKNSQGKNLQAGLKVVRKHLGKSRSASAAAAAAAAAPPSDRRDDSLLQVQDGIQGAILHCKKSFNTSREVDSSSMLSRSVSDPSATTSSSTSGSEAKKKGLDNV
ncbi:probable membrane-associated kinase regulator 2 [Salvia hispanica]|uniref:probable membrane-associated kinase regulator 2 n=1 Tax=Salvia hispanica TaxID=49212 RepID=UPI002009CDE9|nr:probable membrane-associated kinase regulator 2 [Salvia hispanica]